MVRKLSSFLIALSTLIGVMFAGDCPAYGQSEPELTLDQAVTAALTANRRVRIAELDVARERDRIAAFKTRRLPQFSYTALAAQIVSSASFEFRRGEFGTVGAGEPVPNSNVTFTTPLKPAFFSNLQIVQPLTQQWRLGVDAASLRLNRDIARESVRLEQLQVVEEVKRSYLQILQVQCSLDSLRERLGWLREFDRETTERERVRVVLKSEALDVKALLARTEFEAEELADRLATHTEVLNRLMGRELTTPIRVVPAPGFSPLEQDLVRARETALTNRPEIAIAKLKSAQAHLALKRKHLELVPDVSLTLTHQAIQGVRTLGFSTVGLSVTWEPFDWGRKKHEAADAGRAVTQADLTRSDIEQTILGEVNAAYRQVHVARKRMDAADVARAAAREQVRITREQFSVGAVVLADVLRALTKLTETNEQHHHAVIEYWTAKAQFEKTLGEIK